jgi:hypothetical protein
MGLAVSLADGFAYMLTKQLFGTGSPQAILFYITAIQLPLVLLFLGLRGRAWPSLAAPARSQRTNAGRVLLCPKKLPRSCRSIFRPRSLIAQIGDFCFGEPLYFLGAVTVLAGSWLNRNAGVAKGFPRREREATSSARDRITRPALVFPARRDHSSAATEDRWSAATGVLVPLPPVPHRYCRAGRVP